MEWTDWNAVDVGVKSADATDESATMENETSPLEHDGSGPDAAPRLPTVSMPVGSGATDADRFLSAPVNVLVVADAPPPPLPPPPWNYEFPTMKMWEEIEK